MVFYGQFTLTLHTSVHTRPLQSLKSHRKKAQICSTTQLFRTRKSIMNGLFLILIYTLSFYKLIEIIIEPVNYSLDCISCLAGLAVWPCIDLQIFVYEKDCQSDDVRTAKIINIMNCVISYLEYMAYYHRTASVIFSVCIHSSFLFGYF